MIANHFITAYSNQSLFWAGVLIILEVSMAHTNELGMENGGMTKDYRPQKK